MIVITDAGARKFRGYGGFGATGSYPFWANGTVTQNFPVNFTNNDALNDFMYAPNSKSGSAQQNGLPNGQNVALQALPAATFNTAQTWFLAAANAPQTSNLYLAATAWAATLQSDANAVSQGQYSDQTVLGIDNGRSGGKNAIYAAAFNNMKQDVTNAITAMAAGQALDTAAAAGSSSASTTLPANQVGTQAQQAAAAAAAAAAAYAAQQGGASPSSSNSSTTTQTTSTTPTDYTPYIIGGVALLGLAFLMFSGKHSAPASSPAPAAS